MHRVILSPPVPPSAALAELKQWLGITVAADDAVLTALLAASLTVCEGFTGLMPIEAECEEVLPAIPGWQGLTTRPVLAITAVEAVAADSTRTLLAADDYDIDLGADGSGRVGLAAGLGVNRVAVRFTAGLAPDWDALPDPLRHGVLRLAAHQHRARDGDGAAPLPPASVAALWRPWRRLRVA